LSRTGDADAPSASDTQRIDKWLWFARLIKTRTLASELVTAGKVRMNRIRVDRPGHIVRVGDVLTVSLNRRVRVFTVTGLGERRGPSAAALALYEELTAPTDPPKPLGQSTLQTPSMQEPETAPGQRLAGSGRPTKKERRDIDRLNAKGR
jgi:ribosome-associated heat shock protein Hsp15